MNYLAHACLSFNNPEIVIGNLISDFVKGKKKFTYSRGIQNGIALHWAIDEFTDVHPIIKKAKLLFRPAYRLYSGAFIDVAFDHFLANDTNEFSNEAELNKFTLHIYKTINNSLSFLPAEFQNIFFYMKSQNWLYNYQFRSGLKKSFEGLVRRALYMNESYTAFSIFENDYFELRDYYNDFFPEIKIFAANKLSNLLQD